VSSLPLLPRWRHALAGQAAAQVRGEQYRHVHVPIPRFGQPDVLEIPPACTESRRGLPRPRTTRKRSASRVLYRVFPDPGIGYDRRCGFARNGRYDWSNGIHAEELGNPPNQPETWRSRLVNLAGSRPRGRSRRSESFRSSPGGALRRHVEVFTRGRKSSWYCASAGRKLVAGRKDDPLLVDRARRN
jgi:hypothetical protein